MCDLLKTKFKKPTLFYSNYLNKVDVPLNIINKKEYNHFIQLIHEMCKIADKLN